MPETTIPIPDHELVRTIFGARDEHLRQLRDTVGVDVVVRGDELRLRGDAEQVRRGAEVIEELQRIAGRHGALGQQEVDRVLQTHREPETASDATASGTAGDVSEAGAVPHAEPARAWHPATQTTAETEFVRPSMDLSPEGPSVAGDVIEVFERGTAIRPRTPGQRDYVDAMRQNDLVFSRGPAGCGKTYLAVAMAVHALRTEQVRKIVLVRPAVEAGEKLGFLPGDMLAKVNPYLRPLLDALNDILDFEQVKRYMERDVVEIVPLAFMRGRTLNQTFIILDEAQNTTVTQMKMFLTRMGTGSRIVVTGDTTQTDLPPNVTSGLADAARRLDGIEGVGSVKLTGRDIVRHRLVRQIVQAYDAQDARSKKRK